MLFCAMMGEGRTRGLHGPNFSVQARPARLQSRPGPARSKEKNFGTGPARPERETEISARARPGPKGKLKFRPEPGPA